MKKILAVFLALLIIVFQTPLTTNALELSAESAIVVDLNSSIIVYEKNAHQKRGMASTTKIMTALVVLENCPLDKVVCVPVEAVGIEGSSIYGADFSSEMLAVAKQKIANLQLSERISLTECNAEDIPLEDEAVDAATVAFGVRNFENQGKALTEMARTIRKGGHLIVLEFSNPSCAFVRWCYRLYSHYILPAIGRLVSKHSTAYTYLPESIDQFASPKAFSALLKEVGFENIECRSQSMGIAHIYVAQKA